MTYTPEARAGVMAAGWTCTVIAIALTGYRYVLRRRHTGALQLDDWVHGAALAAMIAFSGLNTAQAYWGLPPTDVVPYRRVSFASVFIGFVGVMYLVKAAFLVMYRNIFFVSTPFMLAWRITCVLTGLSFVASFLSFFWFCGGPFKTAHIELCEPISPLIPRVINIMVVSCALNTVSSVAVMALPLFVLRKLQIRTAEKIGLAILFLLALLDTLLDILRTVTTLKLLSGALEATAALEPPVAVIVSALAAMGPVLRRRSIKQRSSPQSSTRWISQRSRNSDRHSFDHERDADNADSEQSFHSIQNFSNSRFDTPRDMQHMQDSADVRIEIKRPHDTVHE